MGGLICGQAVIWLNAERMGRRIYGLAEVPADNERMGNWVGELTDG
jgi:hypothetical protein